MPSTFEHEHALQRLPVPPLAQTVAVFLKSVQPLQSPEAHARTAALAAAFLANEGPELQRRLEAHDAAQPYSWLEAWWLRDAYLTWREGLMINSNWYMLLQDAARLPPLPIRREPQSAGYSRAQVHRATMVAVGLLKFHEQLCAGTVPPETTAAGQPLDMDQYRHLFGVCRVPKPGCDELVESFPSPSKHILLMAESQMAVIQVYTDVGQRVSVLHLYNQLCDALDMFAAAPTQQPPVSIFTGLHRDTWSSIYQEIIDASPAHADNMHAIQHALFAICLDANSQTLLQNYFATNTFHGPHGYNRWFDLGLSLVASTDGHVGINGEHSPCDALVPVLMVEQVMAAQPETDKDVVEQLPASAFPSPRPLLWNLPGPRFADHFAAADRAAAQAVLNSDVHVLRTNAIGSTFIKRQARCSPDAFVQMALQATFFRLHDELTPVYETASTRLFRHGRTETTRSLSNASAAFVRALTAAHRGGGRDQIAAERAALAPLLTTACHQHHVYSVQASKGLGCDRHLLGLKHCVAAGEPMPAFLADPIQQRSTHWRLSTSGLAPVRHIQGTGFGAVVPDGYGMNYIILPTYLRIGIESKRACEATDSARFAQTLTDVLGDMKALFPQPSTSAAAPAAGSKTSKI